jgi:hypothetical protein
MLGSFRGGIGVSGGHVAYRTVLFKGVKQFGKIGPDFAGVDVGECDLPDNSREIEALIA